MTTVNELIVQHTNKWRSYIEEVSFPIYAGISVILIFY